LYKTKFASAVPPEQEASSFGSGLKTLGTVLGGAAVFKGLKSSLNSFAKPMSEAVHTFASTAKEQISQINKNYAKAAFNNGAVNQALSTQRNNVAKAINSGTLKVNLNPASYTRGSAAEIPRVNLNTKPPASPVVSNKAKYFAKKAHLERCGQLAYTLLQNNYNSV
jgi:hypothetical protein